MSAIRPTAAVLPRNTPQWSALASQVWGFQTEPHAAPALTLRSDPKGRGSKRSWSYMPKQPNGTQGKKPPAPSTNRRPVR
jgi:hypothetical protein